MIIQIILILIFLVLGIIFISGKGSFLAAGYNTLSEKERSGYDKKNILKTMGTMMFSFAACTAVVFIGSLTGRQRISSLGFCLFVFCLIFFLVLINKKNRK